MTNERGDRHRAARDGHMGDFSGADLLLAATLCPGVSGERLVPAVLRALGRAPEALQARLPLADVAGGGLISEGSIASATLDLGPAANAKWAAFLAEGAAEAVAAEQAHLANLCARAVTPLDADWPADLPPLGVLRVRGDVPNGPRVAIVGSRKADRYGRDVVERAAKAAALAGVCVVSGGALGTDGCAHKAALDAGGRTLVVLGSGLQHPAPRTHLPLFERAAATGAVVSPFPCALPPSPFTFPRRNAWIAGLCRLTLVGQASADSGALHTARAATALGRPVYALPGPIDSPLHGGAHALLEQGARVLSRPDVWLADAVLSADGVDKSRTARTIAARESAVQNGEPAFGLSLWRAAGAEPVPLATLAVAAGLPVGEAAAAALALELAGWLRAAPGGRFSRTTPA